jgi:hypothetical protein
MSELSQVLDAIGGLKANVTNLSDGGLVTQDIEDLIKKYF